ncbi:MAG: SprT family zinc-dependent metalloprotease [Proteobacteria bacterium]|nr:SprT family zinc-dependent metalloprotease [Pseudomonadota bacterium]
MTTRFQNLETAVRGRQAEYLFEMSRGDDVIQLRVVRRRRKTMGLYVEKDRLPELRVPVNCAWRDIETFLASRHDWIRRAEAELRSRYTRPADDYRPGGQVCFLGRFLALDVTRSRHQLVEREGDRLVIGSRQPGDPACLERQVRGWLRRQAESLFPERIAQVNRCFTDQIEPTGLVIRKMKSRWGSCSSQGELCLNLLLVKEGLPQIDFVVAHELCHLRHFAHNARFYGLMDKVMPDWRAREALLGGRHGAGAL